MQEQLGPNAELVGDLDEAELAVLLGQARPLAREALAALHAAQQRQKALLEAKLEATVRICKVATA